MGHQQVWSKTPQSGQSGLGCKVMENRERERIKKGLRKRRMKIYYVKCTGGKEEGNNKTGIKVH